MHLHAALITALATILFAFTVGLVGRARGLFGIHAPATSGHPDFDRAFRAQMNTLEQLAVFLPVLWLATIYGNERYAAWLGYAWLAGRLWYVLGYVREARLRSPGFLVGSIAYVALLALALWGIGRALLAG
jgi:uncharacterized MAPEG superfamily protein